MKVTMILNATSASSKVSHTCQLEAYQFVIRLLEIKTSVSSYFHHFHQLRFHQACHTGHTVSLP